MDPLKCRMLHSLPLHHQLNLRNFWMKTAKCQQVISKILMIKLLGTSYQCVTKSRFSYRKPIFKKYLPTSWVGDIYMFLFGKAQKVASNVFLGATTRDGFLTWCSMIDCFNQCMTETILLTLGRRRSSHLKKIRPLAKGISRSRRYKISFTSPNSEVECIKYDILDFCNHLLLPANFPFENNRVFL